MASRSLEVIRRGGAQRKLARVVAGVHVHLLGGRAGVGFRRPAGAPPRSRVGASERDAQQLRPDPPRRALARVVVEVLELLVVLFSDFVVGGPLLAFLEEEIAVDRAVVPEELHLEVQPLLPVLHELVACFALARSSVLPVVRAQLGAHRRVSVGPVSPAPAALARRVQKSF